MVQTFLRKRYLRELIFCTGVLDSRSFSAITSISMISGFIVSIVAVVFIAMFVNVVGSVWPSVRATMERVRDVGMNGKDLKGLSLLRMWRAVAVS